LERTAEDYIARMVGVFAEVRRVLHPSGTLWLNMGSSYAAGPTGHQDISSATGKAADMFAKGGRYRVDNLRKDISRNLQGPYALRDDLTPEELRYVLSELAAHFGEVGEVGGPEDAVSVDQAITSLAGGKEV
jgi:hypothetical protein